MEEARGVVRAQVDTAHLQVHADRARVLRQTIPRPQPTFSYRVVPLQTLPTNSHCLSTPFSRKGGGRNVARRILCALDAHLHAVAGVPSRATARHRPSPGRRQRLGRRRGGGCRRPLAAEVLVTEQHCTDNARTIHAFSGGLWVVGGWKVAFVCWCWCHCERCAHCQQPPNEQDHASIRIQRSAVPRGGGRTKQRPFGEASNGVDGADAPKKSQK